MYCIILLPFPTDRQSFPHPFPYPPDSPFLTLLPQVGNGDVVSVAAARQLVAETGCGAVMIGRGAVSDPLIFHRIQASYGSRSGSGSSQSQQEALPWEWDEPAIVEAFLRRYAQTCYVSSHNQGRIHSSSSSSGGIGQEVVGMRGGETPQSSSRGTILSQDSQPLGDSTEGSARPLSLDGGLTMTREAFFGRMKKIMKYLFSSEPELWRSCEVLLRWADLFK